MQRSKTNFYDKVDVGVVGSFQNGLKLKYGNTVEILHLTKGWSTHKFEESEFFVHFFDTF
jgi:hypothetical protein